MICAVIGAIGSGKSAVLNLLRARGKQVCDCDTIVRDLYRAPAMIAKIGAAFDCVRDGQIDRALLRQRAFADAASLARLNAIVHPAVRKRLKEIVAAGGDWFVEASAYVGSGLEGFFDRVICVTCPREKRLERVIARSGYTRTQTLKIMDAQPAQSDLVALADAVVDNGGDVSATERNLATALRALGAED